MESKNYCHLVPFPYLEIIQKTFLRKLSLSKDDTLFITFLIKNP